MHNIEIPATTLLELQISTKHFRDITSLQLLREQKKYLALYTHKVYKILRVLPRELHSKISHFKFEFGWLTFFAASANHSARYTRPHYGLLVLSPPIYRNFSWSRWTKMNLDLAVLQPSSLSFSSVSCDYFFFRLLYCIEKHITWNVFNAKSEGASWFSYIVKRLLDEYITPLPRPLVVCAKKSLPYFPAIEKKWITDILGQKSHWFTDSIQIVSDDCVRFRVVTFYIRRTGSIAELLYFRLLLINALLVFFFFDATNL